MSQENHDLIAGIEAMSRRMRSDSAELHAFTNACQREADRYQEMANITRDLSTQQNEAGHRLQELANGADAFELPQVLTRNQAPYPHYQS